MKGWHRRFDKRTRDIVLSNVSLVTSQDQKCRRVPLVVKRGIDMIWSAMGLVVPTLLFAVIALAIKLDSRGPVFFKQERVGLNGRIFKPWKFRTMVVGAVD